MARACVLKIQQADTGDTIPVRQPQQVFGVVVALHQDRIALDCFAQDILELVFEPGLQIRVAFTKNAGAVFRKGQPGHFRHQPRPVGLQFRHRRLMKGNQRVGRSFIKLSFQHRLAFDDAGIKIVAQILQ